MGAQVRPRGIITEKLRVEKDMLDDEYRFLKAKGLEFGEEMRDFSTWQNKLAARANKRVLDLDTEPSAIQ